MNLSNPQSFTALENSTLSGNTAFNEGGGIYTTSKARLYLRSVTIANNRLNPGFPLGHPVLGAGVFITSTSNMTIAHTIIANNVIDNGITIPVDNNCSGNLLRSQGNNLLETSDCVVSGTTVGNITGQDPLLGPLQPNGGATPSLALQAGSPAIDAVLFGSCPAQDQRGVARPFDGDADGVATCDMGAFEAASGVSQTIIFPSLSDLALVEGSREISATVSSGLPVTFTVQTPAACAIGSSDWMAGITHATLTLLARGSCTLVAQQPGSDTFAPAAPVTRTFQIIGSDPVQQTIDFPPLADQHLLDGSREITATASSGLQVIFSVQTPAACAVSGAGLSAGVTTATLTPLAAGACTLEAQQPGSDVFAPAVPVTHSFQILQIDIKPPTIYLPVVRK